MLKILIAEVYIISIFFAHISQILTTQENIYKSKTKFYIKLTNCFTRAPWCPIKKNQRDFQLEMFYCFYLQDRSLPQFPHFLERSTYSQCARWKGGYNFNHNESFHKRFFPFPLNYTLVLLQSFSKSAKIAMHSNLISYNKNT